MNEAQNHPLYSTDRENLDRLCAIDSPTSNNFVELARLIIRYQDFFGNIKAEWIIKLKCIPQD